MSGIEDKAESKNNSKRSQVYNRMIQICKSPDTAKRNKIEEDYQKTMAEVNNKGKVRSKSRDQAPNTKSTSIARWQNSNLAQKYQMNDFRLTHHLNAASC